jgi:hypothetical protein
MRKIVVFTLTLGLAANAQKIETEKSDRNKVVRVETAPNHLTIIELGEPVAEVAAGSSSYKIEWLGNKVFVQPLDPDATTNLFIWTASGRLSYELVPAPSVQETIFAIDQEPSPHEGTAAIQQKPAEDPRAAQEAKLASEMLLASKPVRLAGETKNRARVEVILKDIYRKDNRVYVRYKIENKGRSAYLPGPPDVFTLRSPRSSTSLYTLSETQLLGGILISSQGQVPVTMLDSEVHADAVSPGGAAWGLVGFECPPRTNGPAVVEFAFPSDGDGEVSAVLVL